MGYVDADYERDLDDRRSMVQSLVILFNTGLEYMAVAKAAKEALWLVGFVKELGIQQGRV